MSAFQVVPTWRETGVGVQGPAMWFGPDAPDGDAEPWSTVPTGSYYLEKATNDRTGRLYEKRENEGSDTDWGAVGGMHVIQQTVSYADFTDSESTTGTLVLTEGIPVGAYVVKTVLLNVAGWVTVTTLTIQVGDGTDADRYSTGTPSIATDAVALDLGAVSGLPEHIAAKSVTITLTEDDDFTDITAGSFTIRIYYYL